MTTSLDPEQQQSGSEHEASRIAESLSFGKQVWWWVQTTRPWRTFSRFTDVGGSVLSGGMSYQALFAVFAGLWLGFGIFGIVLRGRTELLETLIQQINALIPGLLTDGSEKGAVDPSALLQARVLDWTSAVAGVSLLWLAINWFTGTRRAIRLIFGLEVKSYSNAALLKLRDLVLAILFSLLILISAALTVLSTNFTSSVLVWLGVSSENWLFSTVGELVRYASMLIFDVFLLAEMHRFLAEVKVPKLRLLRGCLLGGLVLLGLKIAGSAALGGASTNPLLASFAVLIGLLIWFNLICRTLLLTSAWIATGVDPESGMPDPALKPPENDRALALISQVESRTNEQVEKVESAGSAKRSKKQARKAAKKRRQQERRAHTKERRLMRKKHSLERKGLRRLGAVERGRAGATSGKAEEEGFTGGEDSDDNAARRRPSTPQSRSSIGGTPELQAQEKAQDESAIQGPDRDREEAG
ncbi:MAG: YihY/virulence factor BrkB family protein [Leucobacter sp.]